VNRTRWLATVLAAGSPAAEVSLYVAPTGRDDGAGTREAPLAALAGARDRVRQRRG